MPNPLKAAGGKPGPAARPTGDATLVQPGGRRPHV